MKEMLSSVSPKGQVTLPVEIRRLFGLRPKDKVAFKVEDGGVRITPFKASLDAIYQSVPALTKPLSIEEMSQIAAEEHAAHVANEGRQRG